MTDCPNGEVRDLLPDFVNDRLVPSERARVEAHVRDCATCREEVALLRGMRAVLRGAPTVDVGRIVAGIAPYCAPVRRAAGRSWNGWQIAAAVTLLAAGSSSVVVARHAGSARSDSTQRAVTHTPNSSSPASPMHVAVAAPAQSNPSERAAVAAPRELALAGGTINELDDRQLSALLDDIGSLEAVPSPDVDQPASVSPIAPISPRGTDD